MFAAIDHEPPTAIAQAGRWFGLAMLASGCGCSAASGGAITIETQAPGPVDDGPVVPVIYPPDRTLSPITGELARRLRSVITAGTGRSEVVAKIGDSLTVAREYLGCFAVDRYVHLADREALRPTIDWFSTPVAAGEPAWARKSLAAAKGWAAFRALAGQPSPIDRELAAIEPAFATVLFGTNDIGFARLDRYGRNLLDITDLLLARGVVPILSSIPPRDDDPAANVWVPRYNAVARAVAQARQVPFIDLHRELATVPRHGLTRDRVHLDSQLTGCTFTATGLLHGNNRRNLLTLEMLDRLRRAVLLGEPAPDPDAARLTGTGTAVDPVVVSTLPFGDSRDTRTTSTAGAIDRYACGRSDAGGTEVYYRIDVTTKTRLRAYVIDRASNARGSGDHDLYLLRDRIDPSACVARGSFALGAELAPGTYFLVVDAVAGHEGEYVLALSDR